jgi:anti-sigma B factor antagonist
MHDLRIDVVRPGTELRLTGRLDGQNTSLARVALHRAVTAGTGDLLVHVSGMKIWDASGLGVLVGAHRRAQHDGRRLVLSDVPPRELKLLRAANLHRVLTVEPLVLA